MSNAPQWLFDIDWKGRDEKSAVTLGDGEHAEVVIGERIYRVRISELG